MLTSNFNLGIGASSWCQASRPFCNVLFGACDVLGKKRRSREDRAFPGRARERERRELSLQAFGQFTDLGFNLFDALEHRSFVFGQLNITEIADHFQNFTTGWEHTARGALVSV